MTNMTHIKTCVFVAIGAVIAPILLHPDRLQFATFPLGIHTLLSLAENFVAALAGCLWVEFVINFFAHRRREKNIRAGIAS
jgi:hypothetical protein